MIYNETYTLMLKSRLKGDMYNSYNTVKSDLSHGADPNQCDIILKKGGPAGYIELLLSFGANPNKAYAHGFGGHKTPITMCIRNKHYDALAALLKCPGTNLENAQAFYGGGFSFEFKSCTPLEYAKKHSNNKAIEMITTAIETRRKQNEIKKALQSADPKKFRLKI